jgi:hypothetical protein
VVLTIAHLTAYVFTAFPQRAFGAA